ncbi:alkaline phosphatase, partial [Rhizobium ruizarguesonis]
VELVGGRKKITRGNGDRAFRRNAHIGHYPESRSGSKGVEPEGLEDAKFGDDQYFFLLAERASVVGVFKDTGADPELIQLLPSGISP